MKVKIINPVQHDARELHPGATANIPDVAAKALISIGAVEPVGNGTQEQSPPSTVPAQNPEQEPAPEPEQEPAPEPVPEPAPDAEASEGAA